MAQVKRDPEEVLLNSSSSDRFIHPVPSLIRSSNTPQDVRYRQLLPAPSGGKGSPVSAMVNPFSKPPSKPLSTSHSARRRPIAPKPPRENVDPHPGMQSLLKDPPIASVISDHVPKDPIYVSFSVYGQCLPPTCQSLYEQRALYTDTIVPQRQLRVVGRQALRLHTIVPKSRVGHLPPSFCQDSSTRSSLMTGVYRHSVVEPVPPIVPPTTPWTCSHKLSISSSDKAHSVAPPFPNCSSNGNVSPITSKQPVAMPVPKSADMPQLRPAARLLVRLGQQLVRAQYARMVVRECGCGKQQDCLDHESSTPSPGPSAECVPILTESTHLEWRPKPAHQRWIRVRELCRIRDCPFIPATIFQLHRHLELGHQKLTRCFCNLKQSAPPRSLASSSIDDVSLTEPMEQRLRRYQETTEQLFSQLVIPLVVNMHSREPHRLSCPVCFDWRTRPESVFQHIRHMHPFITAQPLDKPRNRLCAVCGCHAGPGGIGKWVFIAFGAVAHTQCNARVTAYQHAAWAAYDAHPLACLILHPNTHSRLALPMHMASQIYNSMDFILSTNVTRLRLWSMNSYTLRCSLAVSALFGELIHVDVKDPHALSSAAALVSSSSESRIPTQSVQSPRPLFPLDDSAPGNRSVSNSPSSNTVPSTITNAALPNVTFTETMTITTSRTAGSNTVISWTDSTPSSSVVHFNQNCTPDLKRLATSTPESEPMCKKVFTINESLGSVCNARHKNGSSKSSCSIPIMNHLEDNSALPGLASVNENTDTEFVDTHIPMITDNDVVTNGTVHGEIFSSHKHTLQNIACELCDAIVLIRNHREHLIEMHQCELTTTPSEYCSFCGQLFWTVDGCNKHQRHRCEVCLSEGVCSSTLYIHMALKHMEELVTLLRARPVRCLLCCELHCDILTHLHSRHFCSVPMDVLKHLSVDSQSMLQSSLKLRPLRKLAPLYTISMSTIRGVQPDTTGMPDSIVTRDASNPDWLLFGCPACQNKYISFSQLDLHMLQAGHQYWCTSCSFVCDRLDDLITHQSESCKQKKPQFKFIRLGIQPNGVSSNPVPSVSISSPSRKVTPKPVIRKAIGTVSQFHGCDMCPVFCLTLADLDTHRRTAHNCPLVPSESQSAVPGIASFPSLFRPNPSPAALLDLAQLQSRRIVVPTVTAATSRSPHVAQQSLLRPVHPAPTVSLSMPPLLIVPRNAMTAPVSSTGPVRLDGTVADELVCPMCEFKSVDRNVIMQHITDMH
ncbi:hypothetical protein EG68_03927 [Paragonimus skrjabini miyazakii]|uniref:C2H2-type domain-containing protein n=1 Tax=Paragonimus skrjabini miyazakii TaxID=59628 RepID=A0A8S9YU46_9TREM|nr:hypothetical protein EG68_03927 [Paragonimus skrjabini miyazakii]